jgi:hypothetical protein
MVFSEELPTPFFQKTRLFVGMRFQAGGVGCQAVVSRRVRDLCPDPEPGVASRVSQRIKDALHKSESESENSESGSEEEEKSGSEVEGSDSDDEGESAAEDAGTSSSDQENPTEAGIQKAASKRYFSTPHHNCIPTTVSPKLQT